GDDRDAAHLEAAEQLGAVRQQRHHRGRDAGEEVGVRLEEVLVEVLPGDLTGPQDELAGEPAAGVDVTRQALIHVPYSRSMRILIIGGTRFVGHAMAEAALDAGHEVTLLHRNATDVLPGATHLLADREGDLSVLDGL